MRICCVTNCSNSTFQLEKWKQGYCSKHGCHFGFGACDCLPPFHLYPFPTEKRDADSRRRWHKLINRKDPKTDRNWIAKSHDRVCSKHFPDSKPTKAHPDPCLNLCYTTSKPSSPRRPPADRQFNPIEPKRRRTNNTADTHIKELQVEEEQTSALLHDHKYTYKCNCQPNCECPGCASKEGKIRSLEKRVQDLEHEVVALKVASLNIPKAKKQPIFSYKALKTDTDVNHCTGIRSKECMDALFQYVEPHAKKMSYWGGTKKTPKVHKKRNYKKTQKKSGPKRQLALKDEFILIMMRLRLDLTVQFLALLFGVAQSTCSKVIITWIRFMAGVMKPLIVWPDRGAITQNLPSTFKTSCRKLRCIIDCTEFFIQRPRSLQLQAATWSDYKKHNTVKVLVGITPTGLISFLSKAYGGRASDVFITRKSGLLNLLDPGDVLMADREFPIQEELMFHQATLEIPPPAQGNRQMTRDKVKRTKKVANLRIHVERAIGRLKTYKILNSTLPITLVSSADDIITVCAAFVNLQPDLIT